jgi:uncharacterized membrane protein
MTFPFWFLIALAGHLANGAAFIIDKTLLRSSFRRPGTYAGMIGMIGLLSLVLIPFGVTAPDAAGWFWMVLSGMAFTFSLWLFFTALAAGEASRVVPIIGSLIPVLTLAATATFLGERLSTEQLYGFAFLVAATIILSGGASKSRLTARTVAIAVLAAATFALSSVTGKIAYSGYGFLDTFTISRLAGVVAAIAILFMDPKAAKEVHAVFFGGGKNTGQGAKQAAFLVILGQTLGGIGFVGVQYATSLGSAAIVNALQAVQYALLVLVAFALRHAAPRLLGEDLNMGTVARKCAAIFLTGVGLWLVV